MTSSLASQPRPIATFIVTWLGQFISLFGSGLTAFALGAHIFQSTGSTTRFALFALCSILPISLLSPLAGVLVDRWDRRKTMLLSDVGSGLSTLLIWLLLLASDAGYLSFQDWYFYPPVLVGACANAFRWPAWGATTPMLIPKQHLGRASGAVEAGAALTQVCSPLVAGVLVGRIGLHGVLFIDMVSFLFAAGVLLFVRFPSLPHSTDAREAGRRTLRKDLAVGLSFVWKRPGLAGLLAFTTFTHSSTMVVTLLFTPLVLGFTDMQHLGMIISWGGMGMLAGGVMTSLWGGPKRRMVGIAGYPVVAGLVLMLAALPPTVPLVAAAAASFLFSMPLTSATAQVIWQTKVPLEFQGRVLGLRKTVAQSVALLATMTAGPLADHLFEPWMAPGGALAGTLGAVIGTGRGRGIALMFLLLGLAQWVGVAVLLLSPRVRNVQEELPDLLPARFTPPRAPSEAPAATLPDAPQPATGNTLS
jgi:DHA3 family macrolide efflux protein-like MFS transporter